MRLVPNAVDLRVLRRARVARATAPGFAIAGRHRADEIVLLSVARLERNKGLHVLADALSDR